MTYGSGGRYQERRRHPLGLLPSIQRATSHSAATCRERSSVSAATAAAAFGRYRRRVTAARWVAAWAVAYNLLHHLGALPAGLGNAGGGTRWVDWITLLTPYVVVGCALAALRSARTDRAGWITALVGAALYAQGHGINLSANSISNARGDQAPVHLWDEIVGHWLWYAGVAVLVVALVRAVDVAARPTAVLLAAATGMTWTTNALEGTTAVGSLAAAAVLAGWGWHRRHDGTGRLLLVAFGGSTAMLTAYGLWHVGFPPPSSLGG